MTTRHAHPAVTFFGTLSSRSFSLFHQSVHFFVYHFRNQFFLSFRFQFHFRFSFEFLLWRLCQPFRGGWNNTRWPQNLRLRWLYASRLSSCLLSFYRSLSSSFSFPSSSGNRTAKSVPITFCSRDLPESYLLLFFSPTFFLLFECVQPFEILRKMAVTIYREIGADSPTLYRNNIREFSGR
jgi:hypothetical protein